jgi:hypothetical protein
MVELGTLRTTERVREGNSSPKAARAVLLSRPSFLSGGYGDFIILSPAVAGEIFGLVGLGTIFGATYTAAGISGLLGPTLAGYLID